LNPNGVGIKSTTAISENINFSDTFLSERHMSLLLDTTQQVTSPSLEEEIAVFNRNIKGNHLS
jgi:hypothetical protein